MLTRRGLVLVGAAVVFSLAGWAYGVEEFVLLALAFTAVLLVGAVGVLLGARRLRPAVRVEVGRSPSEILVGARASLAVVVTNVSPSEVAGAALDGGGRWQVSFPGLPGARRTTQVRVSVAEVPAVPWWRAWVTRLAPAARLERVPDLPAHAQFTTYAPVPTSGRGLWSLEPIGLWCTDPLGLWAGRVASGPPMHVVVCPDPSPDAETAMSVFSADPTSIPVDRPPPPHATAGDELSGLRPYVPGDRLTRLHWPSVSRTGDLLVRNFVEPDTRQVEVVVDVRPACIEASVRAAATAAVGVVELGLPLTLRTTAGDSLIVHPGPGARTTVLQALAVIGALVRK